VRVTLPTVAELETRARELMTAWRVLDTSVRIEWNERLTTTAGRAFVRAGRVELNPTLLARAADQLPIVLVHEVAHVATFRLFGNVAAHGRHWRSLMRLAGHAPEVTHKIPLRGLRRPRRRLVYLRVCDDCGHRVLLPAMRYGRCQGCSARDAFLVMKAPATEAGVHALERLTLAEVRRACR
jgi:predicted SprT family Zn-dependent metalloprotease